MTSLGIIANCNSKEKIAEVLQFLKSISDFNVVYVKQSNEKLYIVSDKIFNIQREGNNE